MEGPDVTLRDLVKLTTFFETYDPRLGPESESREIASGCDKVIDLALDELIKSPLPGLGLFKNFIAISVCFMSSVRILKALIRLGLDHTFLRRPEIMDKLSNATYRLYHFQEMYSTLGEMGSPIHELDTISPITSAFLFVSAYVGFLETPVFTPTSSFFPTKPITSQMARLVAFFWSKYHDAESEDLFSQSVQIFGLLSPTIESQSTFPGELYEFFVDEQQLAKAYAHAYRRILRSEDISLDHYQQYRIMTSMTVTIFNDGSNFQKFQTFLLEFGIVNDLVALLSAIGRAVEGHVLGQKQLALGDLDATLVYFEQFVAITGKIAEVRNGWIWFYPAIRRGLFRAIYRMGLMKQVRESDAYNFGLLKLLNVLCQRQPTIRVSRVMLRAWRIGLSADIRERNPLGWQGFTQVQFNYTVLRILRMAKADLVHLCCTNVRHHTLLQPSGIHAYTDAL